MMKKAGGKKKGPAPPASTAAAATAAGDKLAKRPSLSGTPPLPPIPGKTKQKYVIFH